MFSHVFIRSTTCRLNSTVCRRHFAILAILPPFAAKCVFSACLNLGVQSIKSVSWVLLHSICVYVFIRGPFRAACILRRNPTVASVDGDRQGRRSRDCTRNWI